MSQRNSLMEWIEQTRRLTKEEDYMGLAIIDSMLVYLWLLDPKFVRRYRKFFSSLCPYYHKDNPTEYLTPKLRLWQFRKEHENISIVNYERCHMGLREKQKRPKLYFYLRDVLQDQFEEQIQRYNKARDVILNQWCEIIDYMWDRMELINPQIAMDDYLVETINMVCRVRRKKNPLSNGVKKYFGKYWRDKKGQLRPERRRRF